MFISTTGFGNTGASAVLDFLRGYESLQILDGVEFQIVHMPDGLLDLKYNLVFNKDRLSSNAAIKRFMRITNSIFAKRLVKRGCDFDAITKSFIEDLNPICWKGTSAYDPFDTVHKHNTNVKRVLYHIARKVNPNIHPKFEDRYFLMMDEHEFNAKAQKYLRDLICALGVDMSRDVVLDMLVSAVDPSVGLEFFDNTKIIVVYRDPVDLFIRATTHQATNGFFPCADVKQFVRYYRTLMEKTKVDSNILCIQYEDLIYNYYPTTQKIIDFLGYSSRPANEFHYFNPDISVKYTNTRDTYDNKRIIKYIEKELSEYIYVFPDGYTLVEKQKNRFEGEEK